MPVVASVEGITIEFYFAEHPPPHFHARYGEFVAQIEIRSGIVLRGSLPPSQLRKLERWASARRDRLMEAWLAAEAKVKPRRIDD
ncbi:MAG: DUF4160 domain-containing protein [Bosea sp. (in: a-proteobacteria)]